MEPVNNKSLLAFIFGQMTKLEKREIDVNTAKAQAALAKQANNSLRYELDRAETLIKLNQHNKDGGVRVDLRSAESTT